MCMCFDGECNHGRKNKKLKINKMKIHYSEPYKVKHEWKIDKFINNDKVMTHNFNTKDLAWEFLEEITITVIDNNVF